jgi:hypothetical protein
MKKLPIEDTVSDKYLFRWSDASESDTEKRERWAQCGLNIQQRLETYNFKNNTAWNFETSRPSFQVITVLNLLLKHEIITDTEFNDMFWMVSDQSTQQLEAHPLSPLRNVVAPEKKIIIPGGKN